MNPLRNLQDENHNKNRQLQKLKEDYTSLEEELKKYKKIKNQLLPQYKEAIEKLKKNLGQVRSQLAEN